LTKKDPKKALSTSQWRKKQEKLKRQVKKKKSTVDIQLRKDLTPQQIAEMTEKKGRPLSTMSGFQNSLLKQAEQADPLSQKPLSPKKPFAGENPSQTVRPSVTYNNNKTQAGEAGYNTKGNNPSCQSTKSNTCHLPPNIPIPNQNEYQSCHLPPRLPVGTPLREEPSDEGYALYSPKRNAFDMLKLLQSGSMDAGELSIDERVIIVRSLKMSGRTQDEIAAMMRVSRRMVERDYKRIRDMDREKLMSYELEDLGGEIHALCMHAANAALRDGKHFSVPKILESMTNMLQSMGLVYKAPQKSQVAAMVGVAHTQVGQRAYHNYQDTIAGERDQVLEVLNKMLIGVQEKVL